MTFSRLLAATAVVCTIATGAAVAQTAEQVVKARQSHMQLYAFNLGILGAMARGNAEYNAEAASAAASNLVALSQLQARNYWMPGTSNADMEASRALPAIWAEGSDIGMKAAAFGEAVAGVNGAAGQGLPALQAAMGPLGAACGACHESFRQPNN